MSRWLLSNRAKADLDGIRNYTIDKWDIEQAKDYIREILAAVDRASVSPQHGAPCEYLGPGTRRIHANSHVIYFRTVEHGIVVLRILHESMDVKRHL